MEKDIEAVKQIALKIKTSLEELDRDVRISEREREKRKILELYFEMLIIIYEVLHFSQNVANRQKQGCEKGTGVDRSRTAMTV